MKRILILLLTVVIFISGIAAFLLENIFRLRKLNIISPYADFTISGALNSRYTLLLNPTKIKNKILLNKIWQDSIVRVVNPSTVEVQVLAKTPVAQVKILSRQILIAKDGTPLPQKSEVNSGLPGIEAQFLTDYTKGYEDWRVKKATEIITEFDKVGLKALSAIVEQKNSLFIIKISEGTEIVVPQSISPSELAASLQIIIGRFKIEGKTVTKIDFQYDKPVIILSAESKKIE